MSVIITVKKIKQEYSATWPHLTRVYSTSGKLSFPTPCSFCYAVQQWVGQTVRTRVPCTPVTLELKVSLHQQGEYSCKRPVYWTKNLACYSQHQCNQLQQHLSGISQSVSVLFLHSVQSMQNCVLGAIIFEDKKRKRGSRQKKMLFGLRCSVQLLQRLASLHALGWCRS